MTRASLLASAIALIVLATAGGNLLADERPLPVDPDNSPVRLIDSGPLPHPHVESYSNTGCKGDEPDWGPCPEDDEITLTTEPFTLHVLHENVTYNCCLDDILISLFADQDLLVLTEEEILTNPCYCICCYDAEATIVDITPGQYTVEFWWYDYETNGYRCYVEEIEVPGRPERDGDEPPGLNGAGNLLAQPDDVRPFRPGPRVREHWNSGCLNMEGEPDWYPCDGDDEILLTVEGNTLYTDHINATYNCCPDDIVVSCDIDGNLLLLTEEEVLTLPCWCICCYEVTATIVNLEPGTYVVVYCWYDYQDQAERCHVEEIEIP